MATSIIRGEKKEIGSAVQLSTSSYTAPSDGYVRLVSNTSSDSITVNIQGSSTSTAMTMYTTGNNSSAIFIRGGMRVRVVGSSGQGKAYFYPLQ